MQSEVAALELALAHLRSLGAALVVVTFSGLGFGVWGWGLGVWGFGVWGFGV